MMERTWGSRRMAGTWILFGALLMAVGFVIHPEESTDAAVMRQTIADNTTVWTASHWMITFGTAFLAAGALGVLIGVGELATGWFATTAWAVLCIFGTVITPLVLIEATVIPTMVGDSTTYDAWQAFAGQGLTYLTLPLFGALVFLAWSQFRATMPVTPKWAAGVASVTALIGLIGGLLGAFGGVAVPPVLFMVNIVTFLWVGWVGLTMTMPAGKPSPMGKASPM